MSDTVKTIAKGTIFNFMTTTIKWLRTLVVSIIIARILGPIDLGLYTLISWTIIIAGTFVNLGFTTTTSKYISEYKGRKDEQTVLGIMGFVLKFEVVTSILVTLIVIFASPLLAKMFSQSKLAFIFAIAAIGILPTALFDVFTYIIYGLQKFKYLTTVTVLTSLIAIILIPLILVLGFGILGLIVINIIIGIITLFLVGFLLRKEIQFPLIFKIALNADIKKRILRYNFYIAGIIFFDMILNQRTEIFFLGYFRTPEEVAFYSLAFGISTLVMSMLPGSLTSVLMPVMSEAYGKDNKDKLKRLFVESTRYLIILAVPICVGGIFLSEQIVELLYGPKYLPAAPALKILFISSCAMIINSGSSSLQYGIERQDFIFKVGMISAILNISLDIFLIPRFGLMGAVWANFTAQIIARIASQIFTCRLLNVKWPLAHLFKILIASAVMIPFIIAIRTFFNSTFALLLGIPIGCMVYIISIVLIKAIGKEDIVILDRLEEYIPKATRNIYRLFLNFIEGHDKEVNSIK